MAGFTSTRQFNQCAFPVVRPPDSYPTVARSETSWLKGDIGDTLPLLRRYVDGIDDSVDGNVDPVGVGGADVVAKLLVTRRGLIGDLHESRIEAGIRTSWECSEGKTGVLLGGSRTQSGDV